MLSLHFVSNRPSFLRRCHPFVAMCLPCFSALKRFQNTCTSLLRTAARKSASTRASDVVILPCHGSRNLVAVPSFTAGSLHHGAVLQFGPWIECFGRIRADSGLQSFSRGCFICRSIGSCTRKPMLLPVTARLLFGCGEATLGAAVCSFIYVYVCTQPVVCMQTPLGGRMHVHTVHRAYITIPGLRRQLSRAICYCIFVLDDLHTLGPERPP